MTRQVVVWQISLPSLLAWMKVEPHSAILELNFFWRAILQETYWNQHQISTVWTNNGKQMTYRIERNSRSKPYGGILTLWKKFFPRNTYLEQWSPIGLTKQPIISCDTMTATNLSADLYHVSGHEINKIIQATRMVQVVDIIARKTVVWSIYEKHWSSMQKCGLMRSKFTRYRIVDANIQFVLQKRRKRSSAEFLKPLRRVERRGFRFTSVVQNASFDPFSS